MRILAGVACLLILGACGDQQALTARPGTKLPPKPATAPTQPTPDQLLAPTAPERPGRSDELLIRSQVRRDDKFDLSPR